MRKKGETGAPKASDFERAAQTAKENVQEGPEEDEAREAKRNAVRGLDARIQSAKDRDMQNISDAEKDLLSILNFDDFSGTDLEKCVLVYEVFTNIGDRLYDDFLDWNNGYCIQYDIQKEQKAIEDRLIAKYGELTIF